MMHFFRNRADKSSIFVEKIANVAGSTAGAGSADYYAYRNRRRDVARVIAGSRAAELGREGAQAGRRAAAVRRVQLRRGSRRLTQRLRIEEKSQKKKFRRQKKKQSQQLAREAKHINKYQSDGSFLEAYLQQQQAEPSLGKRQASDSEAAGDSEQPAEEPSEQQQQPEEELPPQKSLKVETRVVDKDEERN